MEDILKKARESAEYINSKINGEKAEIAIILGSGLGPLADEVTDRIEIPYTEIPNFPSSSVVGHQNKLIFGKINNKKVLVMQGRFHYYEGNDIATVAFPIKVFSILNIKKLIVSNAAGGLNKEFNLGDLMLIKDHINISGMSPLRGKNESELGERFPSMTNAYSSNLIKLAKKVAIEQNINLVEGVYAFMPGPQYETKAEIRMLSVLGADAVGMSTVPEVISASHSKIEVLGISCITNLCFSETPPTHEEVMQTAKDVEEKFKNLVMKIIEQM